MPEAGIRTVNLKSSVLYKQLLRDGVNSDLGQILDRQEPVWRDRIRSFRVDDADGNAQQFLLDPANSFAVSIYEPTTLELTIFWGQSNANGVDDTTPFQVGTQVGDSMFQDPIRQDIAHGAGPDIVIGEDELKPTETHLLGYANLHNNIWDAPLVAYGFALVRRRRKGLMAGQFRFGFTVAKGGQPISLIGYGTQQYLNILEACRRIRALAVTPDSMTTRGIKRFRVGIVTVHGENSEDHNGTVAEYQVQLQAMFDGFDRDIGAIVNGTDPLVTDDVDASLVAPITFYMNQVNPVSSAPALACSNMHDGSRYVCIGPLYDAPSFVDDVHLGNTGQQYVQERGAMAREWVEYRRRPWPAIRPIEAGIVYEGASTKRLRIPFPRSIEDTPIRSATGRGDALPELVDLGISIVPDANPNSPRVIDTVSFVDDEIHVVFASNLDASTLHHVQIGFRDPDAEDDDRGEYDGTWTNLRCDGTQFATGEHVGSRLVHWPAWVSRTPFTTPGE